VRARRREVAALGANVGVPGVRRRARPTLTRLGTSLPGTDLLPGVPREVRLQAWRRAGKRSCARLCFLCRSTNANQRPSRSLMLVHRDRAPGWADNGYHLRRGKPNSDRPDRGGRRRHRRQCARPLKRAAPGRGRRRRVTICDSSPGRRVSWMRSCGMTSRSRPMRPEPCLRR
jgi:hypothetical protein